jgi:hypothetical protein
MNKLANFLILFRLFVVHFAHPMINHVYKPDHEH